MSHFNPLRKERLLSPGFLTFLAMAVVLNAGEPAPARSSLNAQSVHWPPVTFEARPWTYWWWLGSAVDQTNVTRELERFKEAGFGGAHIIPIYGAKGFEDRFIPYLTDEWLQMLRHTVSEAHRLGLGIDMTTGTGWCFGGPHATEAEGAAQVVVQIFDASPEAPLTNIFHPGTLQGIMGFSPEGKTVVLLGKLDSTGKLNWQPADGPWRIYAVSQRSSRQMVKRAAPGGEGLMLNPLYTRSIHPYLERFEEAFKDYTGPKPRAMYHDSYEYSSSWAPDFFETFYERRGYRLQDELPALFYDPARDGGIDPDHAARVKGDYRETVSDAITDHYIAPWTEWAGEHDFLTRNQAHGSPANWLDLYALADIPETEMFNRDRSKLISKFASSAAHVTGKPLVSSETGTWIKEHFTETLADVKYLLDDLFLSGVNHMFYHGTSYSPEDAGWPGWLFYASLQMNPRNSIWRDTPALNAYAARCQSVLQSGRPDNDILLYWPIHDAWHKPSGLVQQFTVHTRNWFEDQPVGHTADLLWSRGYAFDYVSDRQLARAAARQNLAGVPGGNYQAIIVPPTQHLPLPTLRKLLALAESGCTIIFQDQLPADVPGWSNLENRRAEFRTLIEGLKLDSASPNLRTSRVGSGRLLVGDLESALAASEISRESMFDVPGLMCIRRALANHTFYFIANRSSDRPLADWVPLARPASSVVIMDPMTGRTGTAALRSSSDSTAEVRLELQPGESLVLLCNSQPMPSGQPWAYWNSPGTPSPLAGNWRVQFIEGGPELPPVFNTRELNSWTGHSDAAERFAGTARYTLSFDAPNTDAARWVLDLGKICQSARVRLNGQELGTLFAPPFRVAVDSLKPKNNLLEIEVTSVSANRIRDLDRRGIKWRNFYDINYVNLDYKPFDASNWPVTECGLLGPVTLAPVR